MTLVLRKMRMVSAILMGQSMRLKMPISADGMPINGLSAQQKIIFQFLEEKGKITFHQAELIHKGKWRCARIILGELVEVDVLELQGSYRSTVYVLKEGKIK